MSVRHWRVFVFVRRVIVLTCLCVCACGCSRTVRRRCARWWMRVRRWATWPGRRSRWSPFPQRGRRGPQRFVLLHPAVCVCVWGDHVCMCTRARLFSNCRSGFHLLGVAPSLSGFVWLSFVLVHVLVFEPPPSARCPPPPLLQVLSAGPRPPMPDAVPPFFPPFPEQFTFARTEVPVVERRDAGRLKRQLVQHTREVCTCICGCRACFVEMFCTQTSVLFAVVVVSVLQLFSTVCAFAFGCAVFPRQLWFLTLCQFRRLSPGVCVCVCARAVQGRVCAPTSQFLPRTPASIAVPLPSPVPFPPPLLDFASPLSLLTLVSPRGQGMPHAPQTIRNLVFGVWDAHTHETGTKP